jgi:hypothetical protein
MALIGSKRLFDHLVGAAASTYEWPRPRGVKI